MAKQVIDMRVGKGMTTAQSNEHLRRWTEKGWQRAMGMGNYDPTRERLNFEVTKGGKVSPIDKSRSIPERMAANLRERGIKDPNEGLAEQKFRTVVNFIFGGSRERMQQLAFGNQAVDFTHDADNSGVHRKPEIEQWAQDVYAFVSDRYGEENIAAFVVHLDELNPHVHCTLLPIKDGCFAYKQIFAGKDKYEFSAHMKQLHSDFAEVTRKWGLERGSSVAETGAKHRSTEEYRRELSERNTQLENSISQGERTLASLQAEIRLAERRVKGLNSMIENLKKEKAEKERQLATLHRQLLEGKESPALLKQQVEALERELHSIQERLADKQEKLQTADQKLEELRKKMATTEEQAKRMEERSHAVFKAVHSKVDSLLKDVLVENLLGEHRQRMENMSDSERQAFKDSLIEDVSQRGSDVMHCATLLFVGLVNDATTFAETHGGSGGGSDLKWGRDDDEDNRTWARRCMMMAIRMMKPSVGKKQKR